MDPSEYEDTVPKDANYLAAGALELLLAGPEPASPADISKQIEVL